MDSERDDVEMSSTAEYTLSQACRFKAERDEARQRLQGFEEWTEDLEDSYRAAWEQLVEETAKAKRLGKLVWRLQNRLAKAHRSEKSLRKGMRMWREKAISGPVRTVSAYDLLPEEDMQTLRWVYEQGGLKAVESRLMPEGYEWPRYETGELLRYKDRYISDGAECEVWHVDFDSYGEATILNSDYSKCSLEKGERVKRPAAQAGDGEPLEVGQTVWLLDDGGRAKCECEVIDVCESVGEFSVMVREVGKYGYSYVRPSSLTHTKPEHPDSWEQFKADVYREVETEKGMRFASEFVEAIVRRAKALAERGE